MQNHCRLFFILSSALKPVKLEGGFKRIILELRIRSNLGIIMNNKLSKKMCCIYILELSIEKNHKWHNMLSSAICVIFMYFEYSFYIDKGCSKPGSYGRNCDTPCPINCKDNTCRIQSGFCIGCKPGWTGMYCAISIIYF